MEITKCERCGKVFSKVNLAVCSNCKEEEEADYDKVKEILEVQPNLNAEEVAEEAEVEIRVVLRMMKDGMITNVDLGEAVKCGKCGAPAISLSKRLCESCLEKLDAQVTLAQAKMKLGKKRDVQVSQFMNARTSFENKRR